MSYNFTKLTEVEALSKIPNNATVIAEVNGALKRLPSDGLGGGNSLLIMAEDENNYSANMTFEEAYALFMSNKLTSVFFKFETRLQPAAMNLVQNDTYTWFDFDGLYWSAEEGFTPNEPGYVPVKPA